MGEMLRAARGQAGLSLEAVSSATRIPRHNLIALETDNFDVLPPEPFTRGLIRVYTRALAVPEEPVLNAYATALSARVAATEPGQALRRRRGRLIAGVSAAVAVVAAVMLLIVQAGGLPTPTASETRTAAPESAGIGLRADSKLELVAVRPTAIEVIVDGQSVFEGQLATGSAKRTRRSGRLRCGPKRPMRSRCGLMELRSDSSVHPVVRISGPGELLPVAEGTKSLRAEGTGQRSAAEGAPPGLPACRICSRASGCW